MRKPIFKTRITELFQIDHPILCGGLQWLADANYVAAVVNAGGMGFITCLSYPDDPEEFRRQVKRCRELTGGKNFGVSIPISRRLGPNDRLNPYIDIIVEEKVKFIETSGDSPALILPRLKNAGCIVVHKAPTVRFAISAQKLNVDAIAVISGESGGHPGTQMTSQIIQGPLAADAISKPLVLGGGMSTGRHLVSALAMGADAILLGSRMVVANEIWAHQDYKQHIVSIDENANKVVMKMFSNHHRVLDNETSRNVYQLEIEGVDDFNQYAPLISGQIAKAAYASGDVRIGMLDIGPSAVFAREIKSVESIFDEIIDEAIKSSNRIYSFQTT
jgi:nitronate monooxygenase